MICTVHQSKWEDLRLPLWVEVVAWVLCGFRVLCRLSPGFCRALTTLTPPSASLAGLIIVHSLNSNLGSRWNRSGASRWKISSNSSAWEPGTPYLIRGVGFRAFWSLDFGVWIVGLRVWGVGRRGVAARVVYQVFVAP